MESIRIRRRGLGRPRKRAARAMGDKAGRPPDFDAERYKERNIVERCVDKLRRHRAVATRFDKRERIYQGTLDVASIRIWLRDPVT
ncbi:transposase [Nonomuraea sp. SMC257]|uniref:Transposase n=1 Tax=Nonomuraea montanisoli TaxID=2741721 RepID=A0A7Y6M738_9ACTN|nr:transposase [Nonomuraea montanisoli]NUW36256.1 transposase [Nonomuraea montanisoli]